MASGHGPGRGVTKEVAAVKLGFGKSCTTGRHCGVVRNPRVNRDAGHRGEGGDWWELVLVTLGRPLATDKKKRC